MTDWHTHIGQFNETFYDYRYVFFAMKKNGVSECWCAYLTPKYDDVNQSVDFAGCVVSEIEKAQSYSKKINLKVNFLCWIDPILLSERKLTVDEYLKMFDYKGIAVHPFHCWHTGELQQVFEYAEKTKLPIFIHTGVSENDNPLMFEQFFSDFSNVEVHLAHCKESEAIIRLFSKYPNLSGDTAFCPEDSYRAICNAGFKDRMLLGTDFPITHWYRHYEEEKKDVSVCSLTENYKQTLKEMRWFER